MSRLTDYMNGITDTYEPEEEEEQADSVGGSVETAATSQVKYPVYSTDMSDEPLYEIPWDEAESSTTDSYSFGDIVKSSLREHNSFYRYHVAREEGRLDDSLVTMPGIETPAAGFPFHADTVYSPDPSFDLSQALDENKVEEENRHRFSRVVNEWQFNNVINNLEQEKSDRTVLNDTGFFKGLTPQIITGVLEPSNYGVMLLGTGLKLGSVAVRGAIEGALMGGLNASVRGTLNDEFSLREAAYESVATGITAGIFAGAIKGSISIVKSPEFKAIARDMKNAITPDFKEWFRVENGELTHVSSGRFGEFKHKAKRAVWTMFNNSPNYQMYNSGNNELRELAPLIFRGRNGNFSEVGELIPVAAEENVRLAASEENLMMQRVDKHRVKYREEGGNLEQFNKEVVDSTINTYVDLNSGELYFGRVPEDPVQTELFAEPQKAAKIESRLPKGQKEFRFYDQEYAEMMGLSKKFEDVQLSDNPHVLAAAKERVDFWRKIIQKAKKMGTLDEAFGEGGINTERNAVTSEIANLSAEDFVKGVQTETLPQTKLVSLGHTMRRYSPEKVHANRKVLAPLLAREIHIDSPKLTPKEIESVANKILAKLVDRNVEVRNEAFNDLPAGVKFTKQREIAIADSLLSAADILDYDTIVYELGSWKALEASTELNRVAKSMGHETWGDFKETFYGLAILQITLWTMKCIERCWRYKGLTCKII